MSKPVTNDEIEDVLSSIRRLVSEGDKPRHATPQPPKQPEKLVLTPALRVGPADEKLAPPRVVQVEQTDFLVLNETADIPVSPPSDRASLEATIAELEAAVTAQADDWEPDGSETDTSPGWDNGVFPTAVANDPVNLRSSAPTLFASAAAYRAALEAAENEDDLIAPWDLPQKVRGEYASDAQTTESVDKIVEGDDAEPQDEPMLSDILATVEITRAPDIDDQETVQSDSHGDLGEVSGSNGIAFRHAGRRFNRDNDKIPTNQESDDANHSAELILEAAQIDPEQLHKLVAEIVREELQGKLGERITHNVRKLVRREIMRVLNAQDMD